MADVAVPLKAGLRFDSDLFYQKSGHREMGTPLETPYPVVFFDGEQHVDVGYVGIRAGTQFKVLQVVLSQKAGLSPNQISAALVCRKGSKHQKKLPINGDTNFSAILAHHNPRKDRECFLLVTARKARRARERRSRSRRGVVHDEGSSSSRDDLIPRGKPNPHRLAVPEKMLLRRDPAASPAAGILDLSSVQIYPPAMHDNGTLVGSFGPRSLFGVRNLETYPYACTKHTVRTWRAPATVCGTCSKAKEGQAVPFHPCVYDEILEAGSHPSPAGPIERPAKSGHVPDWASC